MRLVLMGPPGAGKGTQAKVLCEYLKVPHISTGDLFRANSRAGSELGLAAAAFLEGGEYVPDTITNEMVRERLQRPDAAAGFLLDGYPRTLAQVAALDSMLAEMGLALDLVVEAVVARLLRRADEQGRADDTEEVIRRRLQVYSEQTSPLAGQYRARGLLVEIDALGSVDVVRNRLFAAVRP
jgi:adenylate kinase